jgi:hypothetical protein
VLLAGLLTGCGGLNQDDGPPRPFGPGVSGLTPPVGATIAQAIPGLDGGSIGTLAYDAGYFVQSDFTPLPTLADTRAGSLATSMGDLALQMALIFGRPDTPCRFHAALLARDEQFTILGDGEDRINSQGIEFHEVLLVKGAEHRRLDCARLTGNLGVEVLTVSAPADLLGTDQVHTVLNSIRP